MSFLEKKSWQNNQKRILASEQQHLDVFRLAQQLH
ncbi:hypothetical protein T4C_12982 [Trichinella pseudospiralis]|uniref:Uncharacterized protein n=1 Tax=Trichinella pseudospiralis TaxID=6337 RepID=A0A0V1GEC4_TRIPS|nr:hypothetical protein T4C_12982 [Trichinella pseudospiralis]